MAGSHRIFIGLKAENGPIYIIVKREMLSSRLVLVKMDQNIVKMADKRVGSGEIDRF